MLSHKRVFKWPLYIPRPASLSSCQSVQPASLCSQPVSQTSLCSPQRVSRFLCYWKPALSLPPGMPDQSVQSARGEQGFCATGGQHFPSPQECSLWVSESWPRQLPNACLSTLSGTSSFPNGRHGQHGQTRSSQVIRQPSALSVLVFQGGSPISLETLPTLQSLIGDRSGGVT